MSVRRQLIGLGCGAGAVVGLLLGLLGYFAAPLVIASPASLRADAARLLEIADLPPAYDLRVAFRVPLVAKVVVLDGEDSQWLFLADYRSPNELQAAFESEAAFSSFVRRAGLDLGESDGLVSQDLIPGPAAEVRFGVFDGPVVFKPLDNESLQVDLFGFGSEAPSYDPEVGVIFLVRCSVQDHPTLGIWRGSDVGPEGSEPPHGRVQGGLPISLDEFGFCAKT